MTNLTRIFNSLLDADNQNISSLLELDDKPMDILNPDNPTTSNFLSTTFAPIINSVMNKVNPEMSADIQEQQELLLQEQHNILCSTLHFSQLPPFQDLLTRIIYTWLMPIVCVLGSMGATICILVFTRKQMRSSLSIYLAGLSFFDLVLLLMSLIIYPSMNWCLQEGNQGPICHFFWKSSLATYPISLMAQTASVWTCVAITIDRFLAVKFPLHTRAWCTSTRARMVLAAIAAVAILYKMPSIFELNLDECGRLRPTQLRNHPLYIIIYNTYGYLLLLLVIPFLIIIVLNVIVVKAVREASFRRREMRFQQLRRSGDGSQQYVPIGEMSSSSGPIVVIKQTNGFNKGRIYGGSIVSGHGGSGHGGHHGSTSSNFDYDGRCTKMATVTIVAFVMFNSLAGMNNVIEAFDMNMPGNEYRIPIGNLLVCLNSATNILIYSIFGQRFRKLCAAILCPCFQRKYDSLLSRSS